MRLPCVTDGVQGQPGRRLTFANERALHCVSIMHFTLHRSCAAGELPSLDNRAVGFRTLASAKISAARSTAARSTAGSVGGHSTRSRAVGALLLSVSGGGTEGGEGARGASAASRRRHVPLTEEDVRLKGAAVQRRLRRRRGWDFALTDQEVRTDTSVTHLDMNEVYAWKDAGTEDGVQLLAEPWSGLRNRDVTPQIDYTLGRELPDVLTRPQPTVNSGVGLESVACRCVPLYCLAVLLRRTTWSTKL